MIQNLFSFEGRMRRTHFWLCEITSFPLLFVMAALADASEALGIVLLVAYVWWTLAYHCKRCHDRGNPGYYMLIPFYKLWLLFGDSDPGMNQYGPNPKGL